MSDPSDITNIRQVNLSAIVNRADINSFIEILDRRSSGSLKAIGAANKIKEKIGEDSALKHIRSRFPGSRPIAVVRRNNGVPVLDLLLETSDGKFVIVEAKYSSSGKLRLGKTNSKAFVITNQGPVPIKVKGGTGQMSPQWMRNRYKEMQRIGNKEMRLLGKRIQVALHQGNFHAISVVTDSTGEVLLEKNHTNEWLRSFSSKGTELRQPRISFAPTRPRAITQSGVIETAAPNRSPDSSAVGSRSTENAQRASSRTSSPPVRQAPSREPGVSDHGTKPKKSPKPNVDVPTSNLKKLFVPKKIGLPVGLVANLVIDYTIGKTIQKLERQLDAVNQAGIKMLWNNEIYPKIEDGINLTLRFEKNQPEFLRDEPIFIKLDWEVLLRLQMEDALTDTVVWAFKFVHGGPGFAEVLEGVKYIGHEAVGYGEDFVSKTKPKKRNDSSERSLVHEIHRNFILIWDPEVHKIAVKYRALATKAMAQLNKTFDKSMEVIKTISSNKVQSNAKIHLTESMEKISMALNRYDFKDAKRHTELLVHHVNGAFTTAKVYEYRIEKVQEEIKSLKAVLAETFELRKISKKQKENQQDLLAMFMGQKYERLR